ncbi:MAG: hypothetical protein ACRBCT_01540 [Alphaproteobacteria bacterium]
MDRIQIQLPPELRADIQAIADYHEWSFAETMRRAAERLRDSREAAIRADKDEVWELPSPRDMGFKPHSMDAYRAIIEEDRDRL